MEKTQKKGITLIALVVTIVVLLILAGVSISMLTGDNGIMTQAKRAKQENNIESVREEINIGMMSIKTKAVSKDYILTLEDIINEESEYALEKEMEIEWIDKNSNPALIKKDNIYCYIYDDLSFEVSESDETYAVSANLENYTVSNKRTRVLKDSKYQTQIIPNEYYEIESATILLGEIDVTTSAYDAETKIVNIDKMTDNLTITVVTKIPVNNIEILVSMIDKSYGYTTIDEIINDEELLNKILENEDAFGYVLNSNEILTKLISNAKTFKKIANNEKAFAAVCENANARLAMYNNYTVTESILSSSSKAIEIMKKSSRYAVVNVSGGGSRTEVTIYGSKAYVISFSQATYQKDEYDINNNYQTNCCHLGGFLSSPTTANNHYSCATSYGADGLRYNIKKFASKFVGAGYNHWMGGGKSYNFYAAIFKI